jgi:hypothetical protein
MRPGPFFTASTSRIVEALVGASGNALAFECGPKSVRARFCVGEWSNQVASPRPPTPDSGTSLVGPRKPPHHDEAGCQQDASDHCDCDHVPNHCVPSPGPWETPC